MSKKSIKSIFVTGLLLAASLLFSFSSQASDHSPLTYAFVPKSTGNPYNLAMEKGFTEVIKNSGNTAVICEPLNPYAEDQIPILDSLIVQKVDVIAIAANDAILLNETLASAADEGIRLITVDSDTDPSARQVFCNQVGNDVVAAQLLEAVLSICKGEGAFAIISTTPYASNQNAWIEQMKELMTADPAFEKLRMVDIVYGEDSREASREETLKLLKKYPDLEAICAPTAAGIPGVAEAILEEGSSVKVTGLGMPSQLSQFVGPDLPCPVFFLWNPKDLGKLAAFTCLSLTSGELTGKAGDRISVSGLPEETYEVTQRPGGQGTEILLNELIAFSAENINEWADVF